MGAKLGKSYRRDEELDPKPGTSKKAEKTDGEGNDKSTDSGSEGIEVDLFSRLHQKFFEQIVRLRKGQFFIDGIPMVLCYC